jgi:hypothetical protein
MTVRRLVVTPALLALALAAGCTPAGSSPAPSPAGPPASRPAPRPEPDPSQRLPTPPPFTPAP